MKISNYGYRLRHVRILRLGLKESDTVGSYECRPKAAFDYLEHISTERQGFIRVH
jgi:hypothetical protein